MTKKLKFFLNLIILSLLLLNLTVSKSTAQDYFYDSDFNLDNNNPVYRDDFSALEQKIEENYNALQKRLDSNLNPAVTPKPQSQEEKPAKSIEQNSKLDEIKKYFSSFSFKKNNQEEKRGYYGKLPDIARYYKYKKNSNPTPKNKDYKIPTTEELNNEINTEKLKLAPVDDPLFLDNILKRENTQSEYLKDIQKTKFALNNLKKCIEEQGDIQKFNAIVNLIDLKVNNFEQKYKNTPDALKESYRDIINVNYYSKILGNLLYDANYYSKYIPTQQGKYSANNIQSEKEKLLIKLNRTIFVINQES